MKITRTLLLSTFVGLFALTLAAVSAPVAAEASAYTGPYGTNLYLPTINSTTSDNLTDDKAAGLQFMVEEEKLARDVYLTMFEEWDFRIFENIARSEQTHMDAIRTLLDRYDFDDPSADMAVGEFVNEELQELYDDLVETGNQSLAAALLVGGDIEEIDILDLEERIEGTDKADIIQVYDRLLSGSENHLRAFVSTYERQTGNTYAPESLSQERFDEIMSGSQGSGNGGGGRGRGGSNGGGRGNGGGRWG